MTNAHNVDARAARVLVAEDEIFVAMLIEDALVDEGYQIIGPFPTLSSALTAAETEEIDAALLDVNLAGDLSFPVAEALELRGIPFFFVTGYGSLITSTAEQKRWPVITKPFSLQQLLTSLATIVP